MVAATLAYDDDAPAGPEMRQHEQRIGSLERGLAVLEAIVQRMADSMDAEHQAAKELRQEDRAAMRRLGEQMNQSITILAEKIEKMAERNAATDKGVLDEQSRTRGVVAGASWAGNVFVSVVGLLVAVGSLAIAYQAGIRTGESEMASPPYQSRPAQ